jgi:hypothetical protein
MHVNATTRLLAGAVGALALSAWACSNTNSDRNTATPGTAATSGTANEQTVSLTGCLQQTGGLTGDYILTQVNSQNHPIGTSGMTPNSTAPNGSSATGDRAAQEQQRAAAQSYRLDGDNSQLKDLVGKQVSVSGRITAQANVASRPSTTADKPRDMSDNPQGKPGYPPTGTSGAPAPSASANPNISASDLARVKVDAISKISDSCGNGASQ